MCVSTGAYWAVADALVVYLVRIRGEELPSALLFVIYIPLFAFILSYSIKKANEPFNEPFDKESDKNGRASDKTPNP